MDVLLVAAILLKRLGLDLNLYPQQGHHNPSRLMNKLQCPQRLCPFA